VSAGLRFLLDMNLPPNLATWLRAQGHDAIHVLDLGLSAASDDEILRQAAADGRIVVSFDLDFGDIAGSVRGLGASVVLLRLRLAGQAYVRERLQVAIALAGDRLNAGVVVLVEDARIRIREINPAR
jgi:predicted nuclease of predicted toxin-antitoxin system